jgi:hypothetical protein
LLSYPYIIIDPEYISAPAMNIMLALLREWLQGFRKDDPFPRLIVLLRDQEAEMKSYFSNLSVFSSWKLDLSHNNTARVAQLLLVPQWARLLEFRTLL